MAIKIIKENIFEFGQDNNKLNVKCNDTFRKYKIVITSIIEIKTMTKNKIIILTELLKIVKNFLKSLKTLKKLV